MPVNASRRRPDSVKPAKKTKRAARPAKRAPAASKRAAGEMVGRREKILKIAAHRFAEHGFAATTVRQIADDVGVLSGSLFHHFASKEEMLHDIVRDAVLEMRDNAVRIAQAQVDAETRLVALIILDLTELTRNQEVHAILYNERKLFRRSDEFAAVVKAKYKSYQSWTSVLSEGMSAGLFRKDLDQYLTIMTVMRMLNTAADWYRKEDVAVLDALGPYSLERVLGFHLKFILSAVREPSRISAPIRLAAAQELAVPLAPKGALSEA